MSFFSFFFLMSDWIPLFHLCAGYLVRYVKKNKTKKTLLFLSEKQPVAKKKVNCDKTDFFS